MADYQLTAPEEPCTILRSRDNASIPPDMANRDYNGDAMQPVICNGSRPVALPILTSSPRRRSPRRRLPNNRSCSITRTAFAPRRARLR